MTGMSSVMSGILLNHALSLTTRYPTGYSINFNGSVFRDPSDQNEIPPPGAKHCPLKLNPIKGDCSDNHQATLIIMAASCLSPSHCDWSSRSRSRLSTFDARNFLLTITKHLVSGFSISRVAADCIKKLSVGIGYQHKADQTMMQKRAQ